MLTAALALSLATSPAAPAASVYTDDLSRCLVEKTSKTDQTYLVKWVFAAVSAGSEVKAMSSISQEQRTAYTLGVGKLMTRLLTVDCRAETVKAVKYDGPQSIETAFELLGKVAMQGMLSDPAVAEELGGLTKGADLDALGKVFEEAGVPKE
jgi:hypothetical protein